MKTKESKKYLRKYHGRKLNRLYQLATMIADGQEYMAREVMELAGFTSRQHFYQVVHRVPGLFFLKYKSNKADATIKLNQNFTGLR